MDINVHIMDDIDNFSDHRPLYITLSCSILTTDVFAESQCIYATRNDDAKSMYYANTCKMLHNINVPNCDVEGMCCSSDHCTVIDDYCNKIIVALQSSTVWGYKDNGNHVQNDNVKWSLDLSKLKHEARQVHKIWSNNGRIKYGMLHKSMVGSRKRYKLEIKRSKERQRQKRRNYVESLLDNKGVNFWKQWKQVKKKSQNVNTVNANIQLADGLLNNFGKKYVDSKENTDYDLMDKEYANDNDKVLMHFV